MYTIPFTRLGSERLLLLKQVFSAQEGNRNSVKYCFLCELQFISVMQSFNFSHFVMIYLRFYLFL